MERLDYRETVIRPAWEMIEREGILKRFNFLPALLATLFLLMIVVYQVAFTWIRIFELKDEFFSYILDASESIYFWELVALLVIIFLLSLVMAPYSEGGVLTLIDREAKKPEETQHFSTGLSGGLKHFLPLFELHNVLGLFHLLSIITFTIFLIRLFGKDYIAPILIGMGLYFVFASVINMLSSYAKCFVVVERKEALKAFYASVGMAIESIGMTTRIYFSLLLVYARTIIVALITIVFPFLASGILAYFTLPWLQTVAFAVLGILFLGFLLVTTHLTNVLEIFIEAVWYHAYRANKLAGIGAATHDHGHGHDDHGHAPHSSGHHSDGHAVEHEAKDSHHDGAPDHEHDHEEKHTPDSAAHAHLQNVENRLHAPMQASRESVHSALHHHAAHS